MMNSLNNALEHTLMMTHHVMRGRITEIDTEDNEQAWSVVFYTDDGNQEIEAEIRFRDGGVVGSVLSDLNMRRRMVDVFMDTFVDAIVIPNDEPVPDLDDEDPDCYETDGE